ncbi:MAG: hypothetical protein WEF28_09685, partial [Acidimicrobiia bacterium]
MTALDIAQAWEHVRHHDLKQDAWIPDCLQYADWIEQSEALVSDAELAIGGAYVPDPIQHIRVPKGTMFTRTAALPSLRDRIIYQAAV